MNWKKKTKVFSCFPWSLLILLPSPQFLSSGLSPLISTCVLCIHPKPTPSEAAPAALSSFSIWRKELAAYLLIWVLTAHFLFLSISPNTYPAPQQPRPMKSFHAAISVWAGSLLCRNSKSVLDAHWVWGSKGSMYSLPPDFSCFVNCLH